MNNIPWVLNENDRDRCTSCLIITLKIQTTTKLWLFEDTAGMTLPSLTLFQTCEGQRPINTFKSGAEVLVIQLFLILHVLYLETS